MEPMYTEYAYGNLEMGLMATLVGMGGVFCILLILMIATSLLDKACDKMFPDEQKKAAPAPRPAAAPAAAPAPKANNNAKVAAIMAAVSMMMGGDQPLKFTAIKRAGAQTPWAAAGNADLMADRASFTKGGKR
ncbi:MAG: OadG family protein [Firmicutes bacterium]|nr:OadG family protein [Bacillota bacterium]MBQ3200013.1 OadG family protein [Bacillota bacterium]